MATFPQFLMGFCSDQAYKYAHKIWRCNKHSRDRGYPKKIWLSLDTPTLPFPKNFLWAFVWMDTLKFEIRSFLPSWDNRGYLTNAMLHCCCILSFYVHWWLSFLACSSVAPIDQKMAAGHCPLTLVYMYSLCWFYGLHVTPTFK